LVVDLERLAKDIERLFPGRILYYPVVDSTKEVAARMVRRGEWRDSLIVADYQTAGKGTHGRTWHAPHGDSLLVSMLLVPRQGTNPVGFAKQLAEAVIAGVRRTTGLRPTWKEPNDVLLAGRKLAGVLVETTYAGDRIESWILSIGLNVTVKDFPKEIGDAAVSLSEFVDRVPPREEILLAILRELGEVIGSAEAEAEDR
jgi:BirA family biotin operon repressor/biotin-[acetyl-CoA-carboxylase] ligase